MLMIGICQVSVARHIFGLLCGILNLWQQDPIPNVMVHNNQWGSQWDENDLWIYVLIAKPDIITFDAYLFDPNNSTNYRGGKTDPLI